MHFEAIIQKSVFGALLHQSQQSCSSTFFPSGISKMTSWTARHSTKVTSCICHLHLAFYQSDILHLSPKFGILPSDILHLSPAFGILPSDILHLAPAFGILPSDILHLASVIYQLSLIAQSFPVCIQWVRFQPPQNMKEGMGVLKEQHCLLHRRWYKIKALGKPDGGPHVIVQCRSIRATAQLIQGTNLSSSCSSRDWIGEQSGLDEILRGQALLLLNLVLQTPVRSKHDPQERQRFKPLSAESQNGANHFPQVLHVVWETLSVCPNPLQHLRQQGLHHQDLP